MNPFDSAELLGLLRRYLFSSICTGISLVLGIAIWVLWQDARSMEIVNREITQEGQAMLSTLKSGPLVRQELARAKEATHRIDSNLVVENNLAENLWYFYKLEEQSKSHIIALRQGNADAASDSSDYKLITFSVELTGTYEQVATYLLRLETGPKLALIKFFSFRRRGTDGNDINLNLEVKLLAQK